MQTFFDEIQETDDPVRLKELVGFCLDNHVDASILWDIRPWPPEFLETAPEVECFVCNGNGFIEEEETKNGTDRGDPYQIITAIEKKCPACFGMQRIGWHEISTAIDAQRDFR